MKNLFSIVILTLAITASGQKISLVADINQTPDYYYIDTETLHQDILFIFQDKLYIGTSGNTYAYDGINPARIAYKYPTASFYIDGDTIYFGGDNKLFRYDGLAPPVEIGHFDNNPESLCGFNGKLYFSAGDTVHGIELWEFNGTDIPSLVADISPGLTGSNPGSLIVFNNKLYFISNGNELWAFDGIHPPDKVEFEFREVITGLRKVPDKLCIIDYETDSTYKLWSYDGASLPELIIDSISWRWSSNRSPIVFNDRLYFSKTGDDKIWRYDGISAPEPADELGNVPFTSHCVLNNRLYSGTYGTNGEVWVYDGINPPVKTSSKGAEIEYRDILYYTIHEAHAGSFFWQCDKINPQSRANFGMTNSSYPREKVVFNNKLYFLASVGTHRDNLWEYDGITEPSRISDTAFSDGSFFLLKDLLYIRNDKDIWSFNGVEPPTKVATWNYTGFLSNFCEFKGMFYFETNMNGTHGLWSFDGTHDPVLVAKTSGIHWSYKNNFAIYQDKLYFAGWDSIHGGELWVCDGLNPAQLVYDIFAYSSGSNPQNFVVVNNTLYFSATDKVHGDELWKVDSISHQVAVVDIFEGPTSFHPSHLTGYNNKLYFGSVSGCQELPLWVYDGSNDPYPVLFPFELCFASDLLVCNNNLIIQTQDIEGGSRIWEYDELEPPEQLVDFSENRGSSPASFTVLNNSLYFLYDGIWQYSGSGIPMKVEDENHKYLSIESDFTVFNDKLFFTASEVPFGSELFEYCPSCDSTAIPEDTIPPVIHIISPVQDSLYLTLPDINITIEESDLDLSMCSLDGGQTWIYFLSDTAFVPDLSDGQYQLIVQAADHSGNISRDSVTFTKTHLDIEGLESPGELTASNVTMNSVDLSWEYELYNTIRGFKIYVDNVVVDTSLSNSYILTQLDAETIYIIAVSAFSDYQESQKSDTIQVTTLKENTGIWNNPDGNQELIKIFPIPAKDKISIVTSTNEPFNIRITGLNGKILYETLCLDPSCQIDLSTFQKSVYFITVTLKDSIATLKIVLQ